MMTYQPQKRKSLSERFGDLSSSSANSKDNKDFVQNPKSNSYQSKQCDLSTGSNRYKPNDPRAGNLTVHLKINQMNRQKRENSYVNRPCQPLRMEYRDKPSDITKQFTKNKYDEGKENKKNSYRQGFGRQISVKETSINGMSENYRTSRSGNHLSPGHSYSNQSSSGFNNNNQTSARFSNGNQTDPRFSNSNQTSPRFNSNQTSPKYSNSSQVSPSCIISNRTSPKYTNTNQTSPRFNNGNHCSQQYNWNHTPSKNITNFVSDDVQKQYYPINSYPQLSHPNGFESRINYGFSSTEKTYNQQQNISAEPQDLFGVNRLQMNNHFYSQVTPSCNNTEKTDKVHDSQGRFLGNFVNSDAQGASFSRNSENCNNGGGSKTFSSMNSNINSRTSVCNPVNGNLMIDQASIHQNNFYRSSLSESVLNKSPGFSHKDMESVRSGQYTDQNTYNNFHHRSEVNSSANIQCLNKVTLINTKSKQYIDDFNYNACDQKSFQKGKYGLNNNIITSGEAIYQNSNGYSESYKDQPYSPNQQMLMPVHETTTSQYGHVSPAFSSDSENFMMDSNQVPSESNSSQQSNESSKPTGFYIDLSKEISEVEALKQKFIEECESMISTAEDEKTMEMVKKSLQIVPVSGSDPITAHEKTKNSERNISVDIPTKLIIEESRNEDVETSSIQGEEKELSSGTGNVKYEDMKFEGRTLLKGGVKPRHIPKMLIDKSGLSPPEDRRIIYLTARNLLELPLPKWAAEVLGKSVLERDISDGLNKEKTPKKHTEKCSPSNQEVVIEASSNESKLDQRLTEIFENKGNDLKKKLKNTPPNDPKSKVNNNDSFKNKTISCSTKRRSTDNGQTSPNKNMTVNKKMRVEDKSKVDLTLGRTADTSNKVVSGKSKIIGTADNERSSQSSKYNIKQSISKDSSRSRDTSRSRNWSRSRESSRSRNRSRSRDSSKSRKRSRSRERFCQRSSKTTNFQHKSTERKNVSNLHDGRKRSPVKTGNKGFPHPQLTAENIMASIVSKGRSFKDAKLRHDDFFGSDRNKFRATENPEDDFHSMEYR